MKQLRPLYVDVYIINERPLKKITFLVFLTDDCHLRECVGHSTNPCTDIAGLCTCTGDKVFNADEESCQRKSARNNNKISMES